MIDKIFAQTNTLLILMFLLMALENQFWKLMFTFSRISTEVSSANVRGFKEK